jgi:predicted site-specific integrase-resolvase
MGTQKAAELWGLKKETVSKYCREGKIPGAYQDKKLRPWYLPIDAKRP